jgi:hypothetical protein
MPKTSMVWIAATAVVLLAVPRWAMRAEAQVPREYVYAGGQLLVGEASFADVPPGHPLYDFVNTIANAGITGGCGGQNYCPGQAVTRGQMAVFLLRVKDGAGYVPRPCITPMFNDVPCAHVFAIWINELARRGITGGCGGGNYCPDNPVLRDQMAVFLLLTKEGTGYMPIPCTTPMFTDVPCDNPFAKWINELARRGVTSGCGGGNYCPGNAVTRGEMAVFLVRTFNLG